MKRNILAVVIPALLATGAVNAAEVYNKDGNVLDVYGRMQGMYYFSDNGNDKGDQSYARFGFKGSTQITEQLAGYGQWEHQFNVNGAEGSQSNKTRLGFAGLRFGEYGSFDYGRNYGVVYDVLGYTDMLPEFGGDTMAKSDSYMNQRGNGMATYRNSDFFGLIENLNFALQYQGENGGAGETNNDRGVRGQNGDGFGISSSYGIPDMGLSFAAAYSKSDRTDGQSSDTKGENAENWAVAAKYDANNLYLAAMYGEGRNATPFGSGTNLKFANKSRNVELVAQYQFDFGLRPSLAYLQSQIKDEPGYGKEDVVKYVSVGVNYNFNKNMLVLVDYKINLLDDNTFTDNHGISTDDIVAVGLRYQF